MAEIRNKARNKTQQVKGKAKEAMGRATGNRDLDAKGRADRKKGKAKQAGEGVRDAVQK